jgi:hypothetical protein
MVGEKLINKSQKVPKKKKKKKMILVFKIATLGVSL